MARISIGDEVAITATVRRRVAEDRVSVSIPSYNFPHSISESSSKVKRGQQIELRGEVTRIDEEKVTIDLGPLVTVDLNNVRLVEKYRPQQRRTPLRDRAG
ncbi:MAG: hypothetical protein E5W81_01690 [Mesorhizobium sp.]|nr:MAG: hypothetical protein E5V36_01280 [Mesorhizobium sp.]TKC00090.1 MAG: hypothetical protein E5W81_01690 [Mesorhizobium sp.]